MSAETLNEHHQNCGKEAFSRQRAKTDLVVVEYLIVLLILTSQVRANPSSIFQ